MTTYKSEALEAVHKIVLNMYNEGVIGKERKEYFDKVCLS